MAHVEFADTSQHHDVGKLATEVPVGVSGPMSGVLRFRDFVIVPQARSLHRYGRPLDIGSRAFDLLVILALYRGQIVSKRAIIAFVWPTTIVEESNLRFQMVLLRKVLGQDGHLIKTIPGRGYLLATDPPPA